MRLVIKRGALGAPIAVVLSLVLASQAFAATWAPRIRLTTSGIAFAEGLVTLDSSTAVALYNDPELSRVFVRRTTNSGLNWAARVRVNPNNTYGWFPAIAGRGTSVDVVWAEEQLDDEFLVRYRRSLDGGLTFVPSIALTPPAANFFAAPAIGRGPGDIVAVAWNEAPSNTIRVRVSTDGGASFGAPLTLANETATYEMPPAVAVGNGVIYVAYFISDASVRLRRSIDGGATWKPAVTIGNNGSVDNLQALSLVEQGSRAYVAFAAASATQEWTRYRRTTDKGANWSSVINLSPPSANPSLVPELALNSGVLHAAYEQCGVPNCNTSAVFYRRSTNGTTWSAAEKVSHNAADWAFPGGVGFAGRIIVLYSADNGGNSPYVPNSDVFVRTGTP